MFTFPPSPSPEGGEEGEGDADEGGMYCLIRCNLEFLVHEVLQHERHAFEDDRRRHGVIAVDETEFVLGLLPSEDDEPGNAEGFHEFGAFLLNIGSVHDWRGKSKSL